MAQLACMITQTIDVWELVVITSSVSFTINKDIVPSILGDGA